MATVLITGANRGIGLGLVRHLLAQSEPPALIIATSRNPSQSPDLQALAKSHPSVKILQLDVNDTKSFETFANQVEKEVRGKGLNVLINNAAISSKETSVNDLGVEEFTNVLATNVIGPVFLTKALLPLIRKAAEINRDKPKGIKRAAIINVSSLLGSISSNTGGAWHAYRASKAALNMFSTRLRYELEEAGIIVVPVHPGWVKTDLGGPNAPVEVDESAGGLVNVINALDEAKNGTFLSFEGSVLPW